MICNCVCFNSRSVAGGTISIISRLKYPLPPLKMRYQYLYLYLRFYLYIFAIVFVLICDCICVDWRSVASDTINIISRLKYQNINICTYLYLWLYLCIFVIVFVLFYDCICVKSRSVASGTISIISGLKYPLPPFKRHSFIHTHTCQLREQMIPMMMIHKLSFRESKVSNMKRFFLIMGSRCKDGSHRH